MINNVTSKADAALDELIASALERVVKAGDADKMSRRATESDMDMSKDESDDLRARKKKKRHETASDVDKSNNESDDARAYGKKKRRGDGNGKKGFHQREAKQKAKKNEKKSFQGERFFNIRK